MDNFKIIYKILKILEKAMDVEEFDHELRRMIGRKWSIIQLKRFGKSSLLAESFMFLS